jgi:transposase
MIIGFRGIDRHKRFSTIAVLNNEGEEIDFHLRCDDLKAHIQMLGPEDSVI